MPAGDLVVADYQFELRLLLMGYGTSYEIGPGPISGFGQPRYKTADVEMMHADGSYGAADYKGSRTIRIPIDIVRSTAALAVTAFDALVTAWAPSATDIPLYFRLPYWGKKYVNGRPRGLTDDFSQLEFGVIRALATFEALDPAFH